MPLPSCAFFLTKQDSESYTVRFNRKLAGIQVQEDGLIRGDLNKQNFHPDIFSPIHSQKAKAKAIYNIKNISACLNRYQELQKV